MLTHTGCTITFSLLMVAALSGCGEGTDPVRDAGQDEPATDQMDMTKPRGSLKESAVEYLDRRGESTPDHDNTAPAVTGVIAACATCHGPEGEGNPNLNAPRIGGLSEWYLARQLKYFQAGVRAHSDKDVLGTQMRAIALTLKNDETIEDLAAYLSTLNPKPFESALSGDVDHDREIYAVCSACRRTLEATPRSTHRACGIRMGNTWFGNWNISALACGEIRPPIYMASRCNPLSSPRFRRAAMPWTW